MDVNASMDEVELIASLRRGEAKSFEDLYTRYYKMAASFIQNNNGGEEDTRDIFQEMLYILVKKLRQEDFQLTAKLGTYIYSIIRHLWLRRLKKSGRIQLTVQEEGQEIVDLTNDDVAVKEQYERKHELMAGVLETLKEECKKIILASYYEKRSHREIAEVMEYTVQFVKVKLHRCMAQFRKKVQNHPEFKTFQEA